VWANEENLWLDTVEKNPTSGRALNNLALVYMERGEFGKASAHLEKCEQYWPTYSYCPLNLGISYQALAESAERNHQINDVKTKNDQAEKSLLRAYELAPRSSQVNFFIGKFYEHLKEFKKAAQYYQSANDLTGGTYLEAELNLARCFLKLNHFPQAKAVFNQIRAFHPNDDDLLFKIGTIELENGASKEAILTYQLILKRRPHHNLTWYNYGVAQMNLRKFGEAKEAFEKLLLVDPKSEQGWYNLAFVSERLGNKRDAVYAVKQLIQINPSRTEYKERLHTLEMQVEQSRSTSKL
jgi:tetratricopeptide (TPR) repeat protein